MQTEFTAIFAIGTSENYTAQAVLLKTDSGRIEEEVSFCGASEVAGRCSLFDMDTVDGAIGIRRRKYKNSAYKVIGHIDSEGGIDVESVEPLLPESALYV